MALKNPGHPHGPLSVLLGLQRPVKAETSDVEARHVFPESFPQGPLGYAELTSQFAFHDSFSGPQLT